MKISQQTHTFLKSQLGQMFIGLILGDGTLTPHRFEHNQRNTYWEYSKHISQQFQNEYPHLLTPKILEDFFYVKKRTNPESLIIYKSQTFYTKRHSIFKELYAIFYPNGQKIIPMSLIEEYFTERSLLYLYLDDGRVGRYAYSGLGLDLCNFDEQELIAFKEFLIQKFQLDITIHKANQYKVLYIKMESSKKLLAQFQQMVKIDNSLGLIYTTKLQLKKVNTDKYISRYSDVTPKFKSTNQNSESEIIPQDQLIGLIQGFIIGGANFRWNKGAKTGYLRLRLRLQGQTDFIDWVLMTLKPIKPKITGTSENTQIGVKIDQNLSQYINEMVDLKGHVKFTPQSQSFYSFIENGWFWKTLFSYKGHDLRTQRGGLTIGLNHLQSKDAIKLSDSINNFYGLNSSVRFRDSQNKQKPTLYIPVKDIQKWTEIIQL